MSLSAGARLGPYEIVAPIGAGGMGEVYRARDTRLNRDVALKILPDELANDPSRRARFEQEARAVAALNHPNIVAIYDVGDGYIVSELVDGEPLRAGRLNVRKTIDVAAQIASGLAAAHDAAIVHRDLKPDNILLTRDGRPKILDFGLAKMAVAQAAAAEGETVTVRTEAGVVMGTPGYMSPEQVRGLATDHRSDIFSFGVILHEQLSGKRAFHGETSVDTMQAILRQEAPELPDTVPAGLRQLVAHCLEKDARDRFQSASDLRFALSSLSQSGSQAAVAAPASARRKPFRPVLAALLLIAGTFTATRLLWRDTPSPQWSGVLLGGPEMVLNPRLSPDGHLVAFQDLAQGITQVAVMKPESGNWNLLTHSNRGFVSQISWSPDGSLIYYDRSSDVPLGVYSVPVLGGEEHLVLENALAPEALPDGSLLVIRVNAKRQRQIYRFWPETGRLLEYPLESAGEGVFTAQCNRALPGSKIAVAWASPVGRGGQGQGLYAIDLSSNTVRRLGLTEEETSVLQGWGLSRDSKSILIALPAGSLTRVATMPIDGTGARKTLFTVANAVWFMEAASDQSLYLSLSDRPQELVRVSADGGPAERLALFPMSSQVDQTLLLPDGRAVASANVAGHSRLMTVEKGKDPQPLVNSPEESSAPMTLAGAREVAFLIGPSPHQTIAFAETASGRVTRRITPGKGAVQSLTASAEGVTLYFSAGGSVWKIPSSGGAAGLVCAGDSAVMEPSGHSLVVARSESLRTRLFHVPLDGAAETEIPMDGSLPLFSANGGYFSSGSVDARGRLLVSLNPLDSWFNPIGILDTATGRIMRVPGDPLSDHHSAVWTPDGRILATQIGLRAAMWKFTPEGK